MIRPPPDWKRRQGIDLLVLEPPGGGARIVYHERLARAPFREIVDQLLAGEPRFVAQGMAQAARLVTHEGEYGAWTLMTGRVGDDDAQRCVAAVITDEFVAALDGLSTRPELHATVSHLTRELLLSSSHGLGVRRRRYLYDRPPGWQAVPNGLVATWYPLEFPRHRASIVVFPAEPGAAAPQTLFDELLADEEQRGFVRGPEWQRSAIAARGGLVGELYTVSGRWAAEDVPAVRDAAILVDDRHHYVLRLDSAAPEQLDDDRATFRAVVSSVEPIPSSGQGVLRDDHTLMGLSVPWAD